MSFKIDTSLSVVGVSVSDMCRTQDTPLKKECPSFIHNLHVNHTYQKRRVLYVNHTYLINVFTDSKFLMTIWVSV